MLKDNHINIMDTSISVLENEVNSDDLRNRLMLPMIRYMERRGWKITADPETKKNYRILSKYRRLAVRGELQALIEVSGRVLKVKFFQDVYNIKNPNGGRYEFDLRKLMPYLLGKRCDFEMQRLRTWLVRRTGYSAECTDSPRPGETAFDTVARRIKESGHYNEEIGHAAIHSDYNRTGGDGILLEHGQTVFVRDKKGRWLRGQAFYNLNNMWYVVFNAASWSNFCCRELYTECPADLRVKKDARLRRERLESLLAAATKRMDFKRAEVLKTVLFGKTPLYRIWSAKHGDGYYYRPQAAGYTSDAHHAGLFTLDEAERLTSGGEQYLKILPVYACG